MNGPIEPPADLRVFAKLLRHMFVALMNEGFEERQALVIIGQVIAANAKGEGG